MTGEGGPTLQIKTEMGRRGPRASITTPYHPFNSPLLGGGILSSNSSSHSTKPTCGRATVLLVAEVLADWLPVAALVIRVTLIPTPVFIVGGALLFICEDICQEFSKGNIG